MHGVALKNDAGVNYARRKNVGVRQRRETRLGKLGGSAIGAQGRLAHDRNVLGGSYLGTGFGINHGEAKIAEGECQKS